MKIYIAASWTLAPMVRIFAQFLRAHGYEVYDFTSPEHFVFNITEESEPPRHRANWLDVASMPEVQKACEVDKAGMDWADVGVLLLPSGRSSHMEAGYLIGQGKPLIVFGPLPLGEFEVQYNMARYRMDGSRTQPLLDALQELRGETMTIPKKCQKCFGNKFNAILRCNTCTVRNGCELSQQATADAYQESR